MEEVFPLTNQSNLLTPKFDFESLIPSRYLNYGTSATTNYNTNYNATTNYGTNQSYQSNQSNNNQSNYQSYQTYQTAPTNQYSYERNTCSNVNCSPLPTKRHQYSRDSFRRHSAHGRISSTGILD